MEEKELKCLCEAKLDKCNYRIKLCPASNYRLTYDTKKAIVELFIFESKTETIRCEPETTVFLLRQAETRSRLRPGNKFSDYVWAQVNDLWPTAPPQMAGAVGRNPRRCSIREIGAAILLRSTPLDIGNLRPSACSGGLRDRVSAPPLSAIKPLVNGDAISRLMSNAPADCLNSVTRVGSPCPYPSALNARKAPVERPRLLMILHFHL